MEVCNDNIIRKINKFLEGCYPCNYNRVLDKSNYPYSKFKEICEDNRKFTKECLEIGLEIVRYLINNDCLLDLRDLKIIEPKFKEYDLELEDLQRFLNNSYFDMDTCLFITKDGEFYTIEELFNKYNYIWVSSRPKNFRKLIEGVCSYKKRYLKR